MLKELDYDLFVNHIVLCFLAFFTSTLGRHILKQTIQLDPLKMKKQTCKHCHSAITIM